MVCAAKPQSHNGVTLMRTTSIALVVLFLSVGDLCAANYYVDGRVSSSGSGTSLASPFKTIQEAASSPYLAAGDNVYIRGGTYSEPVTMSHSGSSANHPITFQPYSSNGNYENVVITGLKEVTGGWTLDSGSVYKTNQTFSPAVDSSSMQVFLSGREQYVGRWPNPIIKNPLYTNHAQVPTGGVTGPSSTSPYPTTITDASLGGQSTDFWKDANLTICSGDKYTNLRTPITASSGNNVSFNWNPWYHWGGDGSAQFQPRGGNPYYLAGTRNLVDQTGEWVYKSTDNRFYMAGNPGTQKVEYRNNKYAIDFGGQSYVNVNGLRIVAGAVKMDGGNNTLSNSQVLNSTPEDLTTSSESYAAVEISGHDSTVQGCEIARTWGAGVQVTPSGQNNTIANNTIHDVNYHGQNYAGGVQIQGPNNAVTDNKIWNTGNSGISFGEFDHRNTAGTTVLHNDVSRYLNRSDDSGGIYAFGTEGTGKVVAYNRVRDVSPTSECNSGIQVDNNNTDVTVHHNLIENVQVGIKQALGGDSVGLYNNTIANCTQQMSYPAGSGSYTNCKTKNNLAVGINTPYQYWLPEGFGGTGNESDHNSMNPDTMANTFNYGVLGNCLYTLKGTSSARDTGVVIGGITDVNGANSTPDRGAIDADVPPNPGNHDPRTAGTSYQAWMAPNEIAGTLTAAVQVNDSGTRTYTGLLKAGKDASGSNTYRSFMKFDVTGAANVPVERAVLRVCEQGLPASANGDVLVHRVLSGWDTGSNPVQYGQSVEATGQNGWYDATNYSYYTDIDVTSTVTDWIRDSSQNYGFSLRGNEGTNNTVKTFDGFFGTTAPQLIVTKGTQYTWNGATGSWNSAANWADYATPDVTGTNTTGRNWIVFSGSPATMATTADVAAAGSVHKVGAIKVGTLTTAGTISIANGSGDGIEIGSFGIDMSAANRDLTITAPVYLLPSAAGECENWNVASGRTLTTRQVHGYKYNGSVGSAQPLRKLGTGTLVLGDTDSNDNDYLLVDVREGVVQLNKASSASPNVHAASSITVNSGAVVQYTGTDSYQVYQGGGILLSGGTVDFNGKNQRDTTLIVDTAGSTLANTASGTTSTYSPTSATLNAGLTVNAVGGLTIDGPISGSGGLSKTGAGVVTLSNANSGYTGATTIYAGTLAIGNANALANSTVWCYGGGLGFSGVTSATVGGLTGGAGFSLSNGAGDPVALAVCVNGASTDNKYEGIMSGPGSLTKTGAGTLRLTYSNSYTGGTTISAGTLEISETYGLLGSGSVVNNGVLKFNRNAYCHYTVNNSISGSGSIEQRGAGEVYLTAANTFTGPVNIYSGGVHEGYLALRNSYALGSTSGVTVYSGGTLGLEGAGGNVTVTGRSVSLNGMGYYAPDYGALTSYHGNNAWTGPVTLQSESAIGAYDDSLTIGGTISGAYTMTKVGAGSLVLTGNNTYSGGTTISLGTLQIGNGGATGALPTTGSVTDNATLAFKRSNAYTVSNSISGSGSVVHSGIGTTTLSGTNTYSGGTTINAGNLRFSTSGSCPTGADSIMINSGGALVANGAYINAPNWLSGGKIHNNSAGSLALAASMASGTLDLTGYNNLSIGAIGSCSLGSSITLTPANNVYRFGGGGGWLTVSKALATGKTISISGPGNVTLGNVTNLAADSITINSGGALVANGAYTNAQNWLNSGKINDTSEGALSMAASMTSGTLNMTGYNNLSLGSTGSYSLDSGVTFTPAGTTYRFGGGGGTLTVAKALSGSGYNLATYGNATLTAANGYTGATTVNAGTLRLGSTGTINSSSGITLNAGGTLLQDNTSTALDRSIDFNGGTFGGTGSYTGSLNVEDGHLAPGDGGISTQIISGGVDLSDLSVLDFDFSSTVGTCDRISLGGALDLDGVINISGSLSAGDYTIFSGASSITDDGLLFGNVATGHHYSYRIDSGTGSVIITAAPEPGTFVLMTMALIGVLAYIWRKRR
jgi:autotransporter-associated beta strand protein